MGPSRVSSWVCLGERCAGSNRTGTWQNIRFLCLSFILGPNHLVNFEGGGSYSFALTSRFELAQFILITLEVKVGSPLFLAFDGKEPFAAHDKVEVSELLDFLAYELWLQTALQT